ncbi:MAG: gluconolactonase [Rhodospirillaceae bacterium]|nr:gluconolactonase [Rhodospirillaceae bacterium]
MKFEMDRRSFMAGTAAAAASATALPALAQERDFSQPHRYPDQAWKILDPRGAKLRIGNAPLERYYVGTYWAEGPAWNAVGRYVVYSDIPKNRQLRFDEVTNTISLLRSPSHYSNGNTFDFEGRQISCEHQTARVSRYERDGSYTVLADTFEGKRLNAPNDAIVHPNGNILFTDPGYGSHWYYEGNERELELPTRTYCLDGKTGKLSILAEDAKKPNGLCFSPDYKKLYIADTAPTHFPDAPSVIWVYDLSDDGKTASNGKHFISMTTDQGTGFADGIRADIHGNIWAGSGWVGEGYDGVHIFAPDGTRIAQIMVPEICANLCFIGEHRNRLFMCGSQSVYTIYTATQGAHIT